MTINYKVVTQETVVAATIDKLVSNLPTICEGAYVTEIDGFEHLQSLSDTVLCNLFSTMFSEGRAFSGNELDRLIKFIAPKVHGSTVLPMLVKKCVLDKGEGGYTISQRLLAHMVEAQARMQEETPMVNTPMLNVQPWTSLTDGVHPEARMSLVSKSRGTQVSEIAMGAVNKLQAVKFIVSPTIANITDEYAQLLAKQITAALHRIDAINVMVSPTDEDLIEQKELINKIEELESARKVANYCNALHQKQLAFSFGVTMDWRLRMYYRAGRAQPQGSNLEKAAFQFERFLPMNDQALEAVKIVCANELGRDKLSYNDRIGFMNYDGWTIANEIANNPTIATVSKYVPVDKCFTALVNCVEYVRLVNAYVQNYSWEGVTSNLVCHQDGTCNGIQHSATLLQDRKTAEAVNCVESSVTDTPSDVYGLVANSAANELQAAYPHLAALLNRDVCKKPVMVMGYGASEATVIANVAAKLPHLEPTELKIVQDAVLAAIAIHAAAVLEMTEAFAAAVKGWFEADKNKTDITWRTNDGCIIKQSYKDFAQKVVIPSGYIFNISKHEAQIDIEKMARALSPNFVHSQDATHLRGVVNACEHDLVTVHDSVGSHPATFADTSFQIREQFVILHEAKPMRTLQKWNGAIQLKVTGDFQAAEVRKSTYFFS